MRTELAQRWARANRWAVRTGYVAVLVVFGLVVARFYDSAAGFSYLIAFGGEQNLPRVSEIEGLNYFYQAKGLGYDAQYYVQIAMHPSLREPSLREAIDNLPYRARRILTSWTAYAMGLGRPAWILQAYALQNLLAWLGLAAVLWRWFPPENWSNLLRWAGVLFCAGMGHSLRLALVDGPSLLLIALGVWCVEANRRGWATAVFALSGLARETNVLAAVSLVKPERGTWRHGGELALRVACIVAPLGLWLGYIHAVAGPSLDAGVRNFALPFVAFFEHGVQLIRMLIATGGRNAIAVNGALLLMPLAVQCAFLLFRPRVHETWWRVGVVFALLMAVLGPAVWEGYPSAAPRVLLPMQLAFNVLVPRGRKWLPLLVLGNLSMLVAPNALEALPGYGYRLTGPGELRVNPETRERARVVFDDHWYDSEHRPDRYWRWASGDATFAVINPTGHASVATVRMHLDGIDRRRVTLAFQGREVWTGTIGVDDEEIELKEIVLAPGENVFAVSTDQPPKMVGREVQRPIAFSLGNLDVELLRAAP
jgi:hypothetical protein